MVTNMYPRLQSMNSGRAAGHTAPEKLLQLLTAGYGTSQTSDNVRCSVAIGGEADFERTDLASPSTDPSASGRELPGDLAQSFKGG
jgi:hypothetical protein